MRGSSWVVKDADGEKKRVILSSSMMKVKRTGEGDDKTTVPVFVEMETGKTTKGDRKGADDISRAPDINDAHVTVKSYQKLRLTSK